MNGLATADVLRRNRQVLAHTGAGRIHSSLVFSDQIEGVSIRMRSVIGGIKREFYDFLSTLILTFHVPANSRARCRFTFSLSIGVLQEIIRFIFCRRNEIWSRSARWQASVSGCCGKKSYAHYQKNSFFHLTQSIDIVDEWILSEKS